MSTENEVPKKEIPMSGRYRVGKDGVRELVHRTEPRADTNSAAVVPASSDKPAPSKRKGRQEDQQAGAETTNTGEQQV